MVGHRSLPVGQQHSEEKPRFTTAWHWWLHHLYVGEGSPMLSLAHEGLQNSRMLPWLSFDCSWMKKQGQRIL